MEKNSCCHMGAIQFLKELLHSMVNRTHLSSSDRQTFSTYVVILPLNQQPMKVDSKSLKIKSYCMSNPFFIPPSMCASILSSTHLPIHTYINLFHSNSLTSSTYLISNGLKWLTNKSQLCSNKHKIVSDFMNVTLGTKLYDPCFKI